MAANGSDGTIKAEGAISGHQSTTGSVENILTFRMFTVLWEY